MITTFARRLVLSLLVLSLVAASCAEDDELGGEVTLDDIGADAAIPLIDLSEFAVRGDLAVPEGHVVLDILNTGNAPHNLSLANGPKTADLNTGEGTFLDLGELSPGNYELFCDIPGHRESGMTTMLEVVSTANAGA
ncbi:MAG: hypothetical protein ACI9C1_000121, partial [Candidatus Aldehydirespiratoraceae bacterium]